MDSTNFGTTKLGEVIKSVTGELFIVWNYNEQKGDFSLISYNEAIKMGVFTREYLEENSRRCSIADFLTNYSESNNKLKIDNIYSFRI